MRAARFHGLPAGFRPVHGKLSPEQHLVVEDVERPVPLMGEVLVRTAACGVCATDLHYLHGTPTFAKPPLTLGHEISGTVEELGAGVEGLKTGDHVLIPAVLPCGSCTACRTGRDNICERMTMFGNHREGGFAEFVRAPVGYVVPLPPSLPLVESALVADALSTPFHAVKNRGAVRAGETVAVFGCGGVGLNAVQSAAALGGIVIAVDVDDRKLALARQLGAQEVVNATAKDVVRKVRGLTDGGVDVAFEVVGRPDVLQTAFDSVRSGGRLVTVGYSEEDWKLKVSRVMFREISVLGSLGCRSAEYPVILRLVASGRLQLAPLVSARLPLERINEALGNLEAGTVLGRQVITF